MLSPHKSPRKAHTDLVTKVALTDADGILSGSPTGTTQASMTNVSVLPDVANKENAMFARSWAYSNKLLLKGN